MSKKHFQAIAAGMYRAKPQTLATNDPQYQTANAMLGTWYACLDVVSAALAASNPRFDRERFREACETGKTRGMRQAS